MLYGIRNTDAWWDLEPGRRLGYEPQDDAAAYRESIEPRDEDELEASFVGGPYASVEFERPALDLT